MQLAVRHLNCVTLLEKVVVYLITYQRSVSRLLPVSRPQELFGLSDPLSLESGGIITSGTSKAKGRREREKSDSANREDLMKAEDIPQRVQHGRINRSSDGYQQAPAATAGGSWHAGNPAATSERESDIEKGTDHPT